MQIFGVVALGQGFEIEFDIGRIGGQIQHLKLHGIGVDDVAARMYSQLVECAVGVGRQHFAGLAVFFEQDHAEPVGAGCISVPVQHGYRSVYLAGHHQGDVDLFESVGVGDERKFGEFGDEQRIFDAVGYDFDAVAGVGHQMGYAAHTVAVYPG